MTTHKESPLLVEDVLSWFGVQKVKVTMHWYLIFFLAHNCFPFTANIMKLHTKGGRGGGGSCPVRTAPSQSSFLNTVRLEKAAKLSFKPNCTLINSSFKLKNLPFLPPKWGLWRNVHWCPIGEYHWWYLTCVKYIILYEYHILYGVTLYKYHIFTGWHCRLSPRGNIVNQGRTEVDNAFRGEKIYYVTP